MSKIETITASEARFPLASLSLSPMNPRQHVPESDVIELAESIWSAGLIQNIAGLDDGKGNVEIVAGGRRLRALQYLASQHPDLAKTRPELANPLVMLAPDAFTAEAWGNMENVARRDLHPAEEVRAYGKMEAKGATPSLIARAFAVTEKHVYRRLALANLPEPIVEALAKGEITLSAAACFTISDDEKRSLEILERVRGNDYSDYAIKNMLKPDTVQGTDRRAIFVGEEAYKEAGGRIGGDLFAEVALFDDPDILDKLFAEKLSAEATRICEEQGWKWGEPELRTYICSYSMGLEKYGRFYRVEGDLSEEQAKRYDELADLAETETLDAEGKAELQALQAILDGDYTLEQKVHGGAFIHVGSDGELKVTGGFVKPADCKAAVEAGILAENKHATKKDAPKSPISAKLANDLSCIALGARQHALLRDPDLMLDLFAYQLSHDLHWSKPFGLTLDTVPNWPTTEGEGLELDARLTGNPPKDMCDAKDIGISFRVFRKKGRDHVLGELARFLAAQYQKGDDRLDAFVAQETKVNIRDVWTPTSANFFSRVGGAYLNDLWCDLLGLSEDHPTAKTFAKLKKAEKADRLERLFSDKDTRKAYGVTDKQAVLIDTWSPEGME